MIQRRHAQSSPQNARSAQTAQRKAFEPSCSERLLCRVPHHFRRRVLRRAHRRLLYLSATRLTLVVVLCLACFVAPAGAQTPARPTQTPAPSKTKPPAKTADRAPEKPDLMAQARRASALALLNSLADEARDFRSTDLRTRVQMRVADALWETDRERARALFRRAWEATDVSGKPDAERDESNTANLRAQVLRIVARRDRALSDEFLAQFDDEKKRDDESAASQQGADARRRASPFEASPTAAQRLDLARAFLNENDPERALAFAGPALNEASRESISFLSLLRERNAAEADRRFAALLTRVTLDPLADANTVSLLASYAFTPGHFVNVMHNGSVSTSSGNSTPAPELAPQLRAAFFQVAARILLRPLAPPAEDRTSAGRTGTYFISARLLPLFERYAPEQAAALNAQMAAYQPDVAEEFRNPSNEYLKLGFTSPPAPPQPPDDTHAAIPSNADVDAQEILPPEALEQIERMTDTDKRDHLYLNAAMRLAARGDARAREIADKMSDLDARRQLRSYIDFALVKTARNRNNAPEVVRLARAGDLTPFQRVWAYTEAARLFSKSETGRASELLDEASAEARRIDGGDPDRARAFVSVATHLHAVNRGRIWETMLEAVKAANAAEGFTGEDNTLTTRLSVKGMSSTSSFSGDGITAFDLAHLFRLLAQEDFYRAAELAKSLTGESPRAVAIIAVAASALDKKK